MVSTRTTQAGQKRDAEMNTKPLTCCYFAWVSLTPYWMAWTGIHDLFTIVAVVYHTCTVGIPSCYSVSFKMTCDHFAVWLW